MTKNVTARPSTDGNRSKTRLLWGHLTFDAVFFFSSARPCESTIMKHSTYDDSDDGSLHIYRKLLHFSLFFFFLTRETSIFVSLSSRCGASFFLNKNEEKNDEISVRIKKLKKNVIRSHAIMCIEIHSFRWFVSHRHIH